MNKYQEALNWIANEYLDIDFRGKPMNKDTEAALCLQELIDKGTPKKILALHYEEEGEKPYIKYVCPNGCGVQLCRVTEKNNVYENIYCNRCGQKIDWSDEDE